MNDNSLRSQIKDLHAQALKNGMSEQVEVPVHQAGYVRMIVSECNRNTGKKARCKIITTHPGKCDVLLTYDKLFDHPALRTPVVLTQFEDPFNISSSNFLEIYKHSLMEKAGSSDSENII